MTNQQKNDVYHRATIEELEAFLKTARELCIHVGVDPEHQQDYIEIRDMLNQKKAERAYDLSKRR